MLHLNSIQELRNVNQNDNYKSIIIQDIPEQDELIFFLDKGSYKEGLKGTLPKDTRIPDKFHKEKVLWTKVNTHIKREGINYIL